MKVRVTLTIDVNPEEWTEAYGVEGRREIADDVRSLVRYSVRDRLCHPDENLANEVYLTTPGQYVSRTMKQ
jgi:hypothetical protein